MLITHEHHVPGAIEIHRFTVTASTLVHREFPGDEVVGRVVRMSSSMGHDDITLATARALLANIEALDEVLAALATYESGHPENLGTAEAWVPIHASNVQDAGPLTMRRMSAPLAPRCPRGLNVQPACNLSPKTIGSGNLCARGERHIALEVERER